MAFYVHIGCELNGNADSNRLIDRWLHRVPLQLRLDIVGLVLEL